MNGRALQLAADEEAALQLAADEEAEPPYPVGGYGPLPPRDSYAMYVTRAAARTMAAPVAWPLIERGSNGEALV